MMNTAHTQSEQSVFERQRHSANGQQPRGGVWQDNPTPPAARRASPQPAPPKKAMRPQQMNSNTPRSQKHLLPNSCTILAKNMLSLL